MVREQPIPAAAVGGVCDSSALARNVELGHKHKIEGTPTLIFSNSSRIPGAIDAKQVEAALLDAKS
jgi:thiol:disulfide interchange protein DsbC